MKKIISLAVTASALLAGPDIGNLIDYDAQDNSAAQVQEARQFIPTPIITPTVTKPEIITSTTMVEESSCCSNRDSIDVVGGYNFTEEDSALNNAPTVGVRYNKNVAPNTYVQLGYDRVLNADYKKRSHKNHRSITGDYKDIGNDNSNSSGVNNHQTNEDKGNRPTSGTAASQRAAGGTQLDRFYLNGMYEFCGESKLTPQVFGGLGYENVRHESSTLKSGGFANVGAGLKYKIGKNLNLLTEAKAIKKFNNHDLDVVAGIGIGVMLGTAATQMVPVSEFEETQQPTVVVPSIIPSNRPLTTSVVVTPVQKVPTYNPMYENLDVVAISNSGENNINSRKPNRKAYNHRSYGNSSNGYYIQVAALFKNNTANSIYFEQLNRLRLAHQVKSTIRKGQNINLLLVGPYSSRAAANADLGKVKNIERGAFIKRFKS